MLRIGMKIYKIFQINMLVKGEMYNENIFS